MGLFGKSTSKQTAKLKSLVKLAVARLAVARRPRLGRRSIARSDVGQLLSIGHLDRALIRAEQVIEEDNMLEALDVIELYCKILIEQAAQLEKPKECSEEIKEAAAGLMFASARCGELPELLDARAILADKFGRDFARAAKEGAHGVVDPMLVRKLSGERASLEQKRRLAKEIAAENDILLEFPASPGEVHQDGRTTSRINSQRASEQTKKAPGRAFVVESAVKTDRLEVERNSVNGKVNPSLAQLSLDDKVLRESKKYSDARMAAEAAFASAKFAAMAARAAVELSRSESLGKGSRGRGYDKVPSVQTTAATEQGTAPPSWRPHKSPSPSPSWSDRSTATSVGSDVAHKGKEVAFDQSDGELEDQVTEDLVWPPSQRRASYRRTASTVGTGVGPWYGDAGSTGAPGNNTLPHARPQHRRHATEFAAGNALGGGQRGQYVAPPYRRTSTASTGRDSDAARDDGGAYESSSYVHPPYSRMVSALERSNEHIARHEEVRRMGTDARALQERVYGAAPGQGQGHGPLDLERRAISVRTRR
ncbi:uncharacterized protein LOC8078832 [Sorghum bicolor]|uniref:Uncharacterized protein n=1 Tax=Sorghum bicolor TaxID=4558 RepID=C5WQT6_SORBI|nr:uncharacterized protein LOC8078832 [Sorghum bicolor]EER92527.1 hypothetical protein SORBI_3001G431800 [Sorghum bicolor]|eukprot:XP_002465529.1 uncharacterized protein LOC8078832 [Sorghum bicolor]